MEHVAERIRQRVADGPTTAAQIQVTHEGTVEFTGAFGRLSNGSDAAVTQESPFLVASITKPVTATAVMLCVERGLVDIDEPARTYLPEFTGGDRDEVTVRDLLTHTSGLPDMLPENEALRRRNTPLEEFVQRTFSTPLLFAPGSRVEYQSMGINLAGTIVERVTSTPLREFMRREIFDPLDMDDTFLGTDGRSLDDLVRCDVEPEPGDPGHDRWDWNSRYWRDLGAPWGGLHSTAADLTTFLWTFLDGGTHDGARILEESTVRAMTSSQTGIPDSPWGLGWGLRDSPGRAYFGDRVSAETFGHGGATGTLFWADPERRASFVCLTSQPLEEYPDGFFHDLSDDVVDAVDSE